VYSSLDAYYAGDEHRRRSRELDFGVWWRWHQQVYRITFVEATGELIAVQLSAPTVRAVPFGLAMIGGDPMRVYVLAIIDGEDRAEQLLDGWAEVCGHPDSLEWVAGRVLAPSLHEVLG
jgi:hypothetical protein